MFPQDRKYAESHEWAKVDGNIATLGISKHAIEALTDLTYLEFTMDEGDEVQKGDIFGEVETVKTSSSLYSPVSGKIVAVNKDVADNLEGMMNDPYEFGWLVKIEMSNPEEYNALMDAEAYKVHAENEAH